MKKGKYLLIISLVILQVSSILADDAEKLVFMNNGLGWKHYEQAQRLNLDLDNYLNYRANKSNRVRGNVFLGVGAGLAGLGLYCFFWGALLDAVESEDDDYYYGDDENFEAIKAVYFAMGGVFTGTGLGFMIGGAIKRGKIREVVRKDGMRLSLAPKVNIFNNEYGAELSFSF